MRRILGPDRNELGRFTGRTRIDCDQCEMLMISGRACHETGCPDAWRDEQRECKECGSKFASEYRHQRHCCDHCAAMYDGAACYCDSCCAIESEVQS